MSLEALIERAVASVPPDALGRARDEFHARTGAFEPHEPFYEERIRAFFDWLAVEHDGGAVLRRRIEAASGEEERTIARALLGSMRSLWRVTDRARGDDPVLACMLGGARLAVRRDEGPAARLVAGDVLDGRLLAHGGVVRLAPGPVFHPREAHDALDQLVREARAAGRPSASLLDPLLRIRMRFDRFTSIHARHVYRLDALDRTEILALR